MTTISLREASELLGVHYMTAYRYVRKGKLPAEKVGAEYRVSIDDVEAMLDPAFTPKASIELLQERLVAADEPGAWMILETAIDSGTPPHGIYTDLLIPSINAIGVIYGAELETVHKVHQATAITVRLMARLGPLFRRRGTAKARVIIGAVADDTHALAPAMMADLLRTSRFDVIELGADTSDESFARAVSEDPAVEVVALTTTRTGNEAAICRTVRAIKEVRPIPVLVGGRGIGSAAAAGALGADGWADNVEDAINLFHQHTGTQPDPHEPIAS